MNAPQLAGTKCSVLIAEYATGHIFKKDLTLFFEGENEQEVFQVFDSVCDAENFAFSLIKSNPKFECVIYNSNGEYLKTCNVSGE